MNDTNDTNIANDDRPHYLCVKLQHTDVIKNKLKTKNNIYAKLAGETRDSNANVIRSSACKDCRILRPSLDEKRSLQQGRQKKLCNS